MDSLLATYASSDDEEENPSASFSKPKSSISIHFPPPISKPSLFSRLPPPKTSVSSSSSSLFSSIPPPKSQPPNRSAEPNKPILPQPSSNPNPRRIVQFTVPLNPSLKSKAFDDDDEEEEEEERKPIKDLSSNSTSSGGFSSLLPAPKNSLCLAPTANSRRSVVDSNVSFSNSEVLKQESSNFENPGISNLGAFDGGEQERGNFEGYENYGVYEGNESYVGYDNEGIGGDYGGYAGNWADATAATEALPASSIPELGRIGKRGRNEIPPEFVEVNQSELMKNRPREDKVKLTGIAFGPAYQPVSTSKGKPSKLHKRKHQISTLYYDMKQKEMELTERRAKGFLTKAETQAKYGW